MELARGSVHWIDDGIAGETPPRALSWWGDQIQVRLHPDDGGTTVVEIVSCHNGVAGFMDFDNVAKVRKSFKRTMKSLGVTVAWTRPALN